ncbi:MAG: hypothetical protein RIT45_672 [Pseudomonadota bacterium]
MANASTRVFGLAALGDDVIAGADVATSGGKRIIELRRFGPTGTLVWKSNVSSTHPLAGVALATHPSGKIALLGGETINKSGKLFDNVAVRFFDANGKAVGLPYSKNLGTVYNSLKVGRGGVQWIASNKAMVYLDFAMAGYSVGEVKTGAFAAVIGESGAAVEEGGLEPKYPPYDENPITGQAISQAELLLGSGRIVRTRLRASLKGKTAGLIEATDSKGANPQRYDRAFAGEPAVALPLGKDNVVFAGPLAGGKGVHVRVTDHRGNEAWSWTRSTGDFGGVALDGERRILLAFSQDDVSGARQGYVVRFSAYGHETCADAGVCYGKAVASCDDGDACTVDSCDGKTGCTHQAAPSLSCDVANGCSQRATCDTNGACVPGDEGRMFTVPTPLATAWVPAAFVQLGSLGEQVCFMARQSGWVDPRNYCIRTDEVAPAPPLTTGARSGCVSGLPQIDANTEGFVDATVGGKLGCVRWGRKAYNVSGKTSYRALFARRGNTSWDKQACGTSACSALPLAMHPTPGGSSWAVMYEDYPSLGKIGPLKAVRYTNHLARRHSPDQRRSARDAYRGRRPVHGRRTDEEDLPRRTALRQRELRVPAHLRHAGEQVHLARSALGRRLGNRHGRQAEQHLPPRRGPHRPLGSSELHRRRKMQRQRPGRLRRRQQLPLQRLQRRDRQVQRRQARLDRAVRDVGRLHDGGHVQRLRSARTRRRRRLPLSGLLHPFRLAALALVGASLVFAGCTGAATKPAGALMPPPATVRATLDAGHVGTLGPLEPLRYADGADAASERPGHVRAASAVRRFGGALWMAQDDANFLAVRTDDGKVRAIALPPGPDGKRLFSEKAGNKGHKMDLEAAVVLPDGRLCAIGSGSKPARRRFVLIDSTEQVRVVDATPLYLALEAHKPFSGSELNIEGVVVVGDRLRLFNRGNGDPNGAERPVDATVDLDLAAFVAFVDGKASAPALGTVRRYDLGQIDGVKLTFTDAAALPDGRVAFLAAAEASPDAYHDGEVRGCRVGLIEGEQVRTFELRDAAGKACGVKLEGIEWLGADADTLRFFVVADVDDTEVPALGGPLTLPLRR